MKKTIITICLFAMLIAPIQAGAVNELQVKEQYIQSLTEVIALLMKQVEELVFQLQTQVIGDESIISTIELQPQLKTKTENKTFTLPNGAIIEMDEYGNIVKTIKEAPEKPKEEWAKWKFCYPDKFIVTDNGVMNKQEWNTQTQRCEEIEWFSWKDCSAWGIRIWDKEKQECVEDTDKIERMRSWSHYSGHGYYPNGIYPDHYKN